MATSPAGRMLGRQLQQMQSDKDIPGISCGLVDNNVFEWEVMLMISDDVKLYGGMSRPSFSSPGLGSAYVLRQPHRVLDHSSWKCRTC
jgi:ubiquitin-protein ligase